MLDFRHICGEVQLVTTYVIASDNVEYVMQCLDLSATLELDMWEQVLMLPAC